MGKALTESFWELDMYSLCLGSMRIGMWMWIDSRAERNRAVQAVRTSKVSSVRSLSFEPAWSLLTWNAVRGHLEGGAHQEGVPMETLRIKGGRCKRPGLTQVLGMHWRVPLRDSSENPTGPREKVFSSLNLSPLLQLQREPRCENSLGKYRMYYIITFNVINTHLVNATLNKGRRCYCDRGCFLSLCEPCERVWRMSECLDPRKAEQLRQRSVGRSAWKRGFYCWSRQWFAV